ncbi:hypothetical protein [Aliidiomarina minuta]|uniref:hypothetical protein n=1 Tax=Aliidiomarina minuta TaxID=880057 RepID=UPI001F545263|nr:hypothetical protein [Aliidiomarina minuta]
MTLRIITLTENSPLAELGARDGDYILRINGHEVSRQADLNRVYQTAHAEIEIKRGQDEFAIQLSADEPGATVEDGDGEFFKLLPSSTPIEATSSTSSSALGESSFDEPSNAEKAIMIVAWTFLILNIAGTGLVLMSEFGLHSQSAGPSEVINFQLIAVMIVACLSSSFLVAFAAMLCHYKRHLQNIEKALVKQTD